MNKLTKWLKYKCCPVAADIDPLTEQIIHESNMQVEIIKLMLLEQSLRMRLDVSKWQEQIERSEQNYQEFLRLR